MVIKDLPLFPGLKLPAKIAAFSLILFINSSLLKAQTTPNPSLYEQTSEVAGLIIQYGQDVNAIKDFYSPYTSIDGYEDQSVLTSPEERKRLFDIDNDYLLKLKQANFDSMSIYGKVDYTLLKKTINFDLGQLKKDEDEYNKISAYIPFADDIYQLEKKRRRGITTDGQDVALQLSNILKTLNTSKASFSKVASIDMPLARKGNAALLGLRSRLKSFYDFYMGYDPNFTWWVPKPYQNLDSALNMYAALVLSKGKINTTPKAR